MKSIFVNVTRTIWNCLALFAAFRIVTYLTTELFCSKQEVYVAPDSAEVLKDADDLELFFDIAHGK